MWQLIRRFLTSILGPPEESRDNETPANNPNERAQAKARARFWAEFREGQNEADARSRS